MEQVKASEAISDGHIIKAKCMIETYRGGSRIYKKGGG